MLNFMIGMLLGVVASSFIQVLFSWSNSALPTFLVSLACLTGAAVAKFVIWFQGEE